MDKRLNIGYFVTEGFRAIGANGFMSFAAVCMIVACLLIMGSFSLVVVNMDEMLGDLESKNEFLAYVDENFSTAEARTMEGSLTNAFNVAGVDFVTREQAMEDFLSKQSDNALLDTLPADVLRDRYRIRVVDITLMEESVNAVAEVPGVADISVELDIVKGFMIVRNIANVIASVLVTILVIISLFIMSNTIKLATFYRREEISIMKMCGATNGFVRGPFVIEGMILGLLGAFAAFLLQWIFYQLVYNLLQDTSGISVITMTPFLSMAGNILTIFLAAGFSIGVGGSLLAIRKFLQV